MKKENKENLYTKLTHAIKKNNIKSIQSLVKYGVYSRHRFSDEALINLAFSKKSEEIIFILYESKYFDKINKEMVTDLCIKSGIKKLLEFFNKEFNITDINEYNRQLNFSLLNPEVNIAKYLVNKTNINTVEFESIKGLVTRHYLDVFSVCIESGYELNSYRCLYLLAEAIKSNNMEMITYMLNGNEMFFKQLDSAVNMSLYNLTQPVKDSIETYKNSKKLKEKLEISLNKDEEIPNKPAKKLKV